MRSEQEIKTRMAALLESINDHECNDVNMSLAIAIRELEWVLEVREK